LLNLDKGLIGIHARKRARLLLILAALGLLREKHGVDVREHTALGDGDAAEQLVELLVVADGELQVPRDDAGLLVVLRSRDGGGMW